MKLRLFKTLLMVVVAFFATISNVSAQSTAEMTMARELARQQGYSEDQINAMFANAKGSSVGNSQSVTVAPRERSTAQIVIAGESEIEKGGETKSSGIFGHSIFRNKELNFIPNYNIPTPVSYKLAAGDRLIIDLWGDVIKEILVDVSPDGVIIIPDLGPVFVSGESISKAEETIKRALSKIYSGLSATPQTTFMNVSLNSVRSVMVNVVGDVARPGTYTIPSLSTLATVMYMSGGPSDIGSVRNINLYRGNKLISTLDIYQFLLNGKFDDNVRLEDNDIITVEPRYGSVALNGALKRPMSYEITKGETLADVINYAGGFNYNAYTPSVVVDRRYAEGDVKGAPSRSFVVEAKDYRTFELMSGDIVTVKNNETRYANKVTITGSVWREGDYALGKGKNEATTLHKLLTLAGGLKEETYLERGIILRLSENRELEQLSFSPIEVLTKKSDVTLMPDDVVRIYTVNEIKENTTVSIFGEVNKPSDGGNLYPYREGMTLGDLIVQSGGLAHGAMVGNIEIARRVLNTEILDTESDTVSNIITVNLLKNPDAIDTKLEPYDLVLVRKAINYKPQMGVRVEGEVKYPGAYVIENNTVRVSDLVAKSKGVTSDAHLSGAKIIRKVTLKERQKFEKAAKTEISAAEIDSVALAIGMMDIDDTYEISIDLSAALNNPGSLEDLVLEKDDILIIPRLNNTVKIMGGVYDENVIAFNPKLSLTDYIDNAGGFKKRAFKRRVYVIHANGSISKRGRPNFEVTPGSIIVVPERAPRIQNDDWVKIASISTSAISSIALILSVLK